MVADILEDFRNYNFKSPFLIDGIIGVISVLWLMDKTGWIKIYYAVISGTIHFRVAFDLCLGTNSRNSRYKKNVVKVCNYTFYYILTEIWNVLY